MVERRAVRRRQGGCHPAEDAEEISDHADEAEEALVEVLLDLIPDLPEREEAGRLETPAPKRPKPRGRNAKVILLRGIEDISVLLQAEVQGAISDVYRQASDDENKSFEGMSESIEYASDSIEAALLAVEPDYFKQELASETDADERIAKAAHLEYIEARRAEVRQTNSFSRLVSDATKKIHAIEEANGATAALISKLISTITEALRNRPCTS